MADTDWDGERDIWASHISETNHRLKCASVGDWWLGRVNDPVFDTCVRTHYSDLGGLQLFQVTLEARWSSFNLPRWLNIDRLSACFNIMNLGLSSNMPFCVNPLLMSELCPNNVISVAFCHRNTTWTHPSCLSSCCCDVIWEHTLGSQQECERTYFLWIPTHNENLACMTLAQLGTKPSSVSQTKVGTTLLCVVYRLCLHLPVLTVQYSRVHFFKVRHYSVMLALQTCLFSCCRMYTYNSVLNHHKPHSQKTSYFTIFITQLHVMTLLLIDMRTNLCTFEDLWHHFHCPSGLAGLSSHIRDKTCAGDENTLLDWLNRSYPKHWNSKDYTEMSNRRTVKVNTREYLVMSLCTGLFTWYYSVVMLDSKIICNT